MQHSCKVGVAHTPLMYKPLALSHPPWPILSRPFSLFPHSLI
jgi:hypothetical protein